MTDKELDQILVDTLHAILEETKDCAEYVKNIHTPEYDDINEDYEFIIDDLTELLKTVKTIDDLAELDEDEIGNVFEYLETYAANFIISNIPEQKKLDLENYQKIETLLSLFLDSDEEEEI